MRYTTSLNDLATKCTSTISDMPRNPNHGGSRMEEAILKIIELEDCLKKDIEKLEIYQIVKENCATEYNGATPQDDVMERLLLARKGN